jgi:hypothetical protein
MEAVAVFPSRADIPANHSVSRPTAAIWRGITGAAGGRADGQTDGRKERETDTHNYEADSDRPAGRATMATWVPSVWGGGVPTPHHVVSRHFHPDTTKMNRMHFVLNGMHNRTFGPYLAVIHGIPCPSGGRHAVARVGAGTLGDGARAGLPGLGPVDVWRF